MGSCLRASSSRRPPGRTWNLGRRAGDTRSGTVVPGVAIGEKGLCGRVSRPSDRPIRGRIRRASRPGPTRFRRESLAPASRPGSCGLTDREPLRAGASESFHRCGGEPGRRPGGHRRVAPG
jgi:hypothetical protein